MLSSLRKWSFVLLGAVAMTGIQPRQADADTVELLNVSYDPTRELYREFNEAFVKHYKATTGVDVRVQQSHGGSGSQARAVIDGLQADVVTLALAYDIDAIHQNGNLLPADWQSKLPHNSAPYSSTLAFLVRKGNPKNIRDWSDLARPDVAVITANPKTSGVARWNYLAFWGEALRRELGPDFRSILADPTRADDVAKAQAKARDFVAAIYKNVPTLDRAARGATNTFIQRGIGDVLVNWENEILLGGNELNKQGFEIIVPPTGIRAEPVVAVVEANAKKRGTTEVARAYLEFLYSKTGQEIAAKNYYRPVDPEIAEKHRDKFPTLNLFTIEEIFGGWQKAHNDHFADGGTFDQIYTKKD